MPSTSCSINGPSLHSSRTLGSRHSIETGDRYLFHTNSSISKISVEPSGGMRIASTEHGDEILLILLHNPCLFLNRCKGTKNIIDKQIIFSIFASVISIIKEANDPSTIEIISGRRCARASRGRTLTRWNRYLSPVSFISGTPLKCKKKISKLR